MVKLLPIKIYPEPILRQKAQKVTVADLARPEIQQLILDMGKKVNVLELAKAGLLPATWSGALNTNFPALPSEAS